MIGSGDPEPQALNLKWTSKGPCWVFSMECHIYEIAWALWLQQWGLFDDVAWLRTECTHVVTRGACWVDFVGRRCWVFMAWGIDLAYCKNRPWRTLSEGLESSQIVQRHDVRGFAAPHAGPMVLTPSGLIQLRPQLWCQRLSLKACLSVLFGKCPRSLCG